MAQQDAYRLAIGMTGTALSAMQRAEVAEEKLSVTERRAAVAEGLAEERSQALQQVEEEKRRMQEGYEREVTTLARQLAEERGLRSSFATSGAQASGVAARREAAAVPPSVPQATPHRTFLDRFRVFGRPRGAEGTPVGAAHAATSAAPPLTPAA